MLQINLREKRKGKQKMDTPEIQATLVTRNRPNINKTTKQTKHKQFRKPKRWAHGSDQQIQDQSARINLIISFGNIFQIFCRDQAYKKNKDWCYWSLF